MTPGHPNGSVQKPILVLVNPRSGRGNSIKALEKIILPMLKSQNLDYKVFVTQANVRVNDILNETNLSNLTQFKLILVVSGDGLLHEAVNTILARSDKQEAIKVPLGIVPTGSGNGMAYTLIRQNHPQLVTGKEAVRLCCQKALNGGGVLSSDLVKISYGKSTTIWSFLSFGWGLIADIDVDSEWLRPLGELRFTIYGLVRACIGKSWRAKLCYVRKQAEKSENPNCDTSDSIQEKCEIEDDFACVYAVYQSHISSSIKFAPTSTLSDNTIYLTYIRGRISFIQTIKFLLAIENGTQHKLPFVCVVPVVTFTFQPLEASKVVVDGENIPWTTDDGPLRAEIMPKLLNLSWC